MRKPGDRLITVVVPEGIYRKLKTNKRAIGSTIQHQVNSIIAEYFSRKTR